MAHDDDGKDLSDMLDQLAQAQKQQEAELSELAGSDPSLGRVPRAVSESIADAVLSGEAGLGSATTLMEPRDAHAGPGEEPPMALVPSIDSHTSIDPHATDEGHEAAPDPAGGVEPQPEPEQAIAELAHDTGHAEPEAMNDAVAGLYAAQHEGESEPEQDLLAALAAQAGSDDEAAAFIGDQAVNTDEETAPAWGGESDNAQAPAQWPAPQEEATFPSRAESARSGGTRSAGRNIKARKPDANLKAIFAPVLVTLGLVTLAPAVWGVLILMGQEVWMSHGEGVETMAKVMLACWPIGLGLLAGGIVSFVQVGKEKAKQRRREELNANRG